MAPAAAGPAMLPKFEKAVMKPKAKPILAGGTRTAGIE